jgi:hypothetical protein
LGDWCPWSGQPVDAPNDITTADDDRCPQGCPDSTPTDDRNK